MNVQADLNLRRVHTSEATLSDTEAQMLGTCRVKPR